MVGCWLVACRLTQPSWILLRRSYCELVVRRGEGLRCLPVATPSEGVVIAATGNDSTNDCNVNQNGNYFYLGQFQTRLAGAAGRQCAHRTVTLIQV